VKKRKNLVLSTYRKYIHRFEICQNCMKVKIWGKTFLELTRRYIFWSIVHLGESTLQRNLLNKTQGSTFLSRNLYGGYHRDVKFQNLEHVVLFLDPNYWTKEAIDLLYDVIHFTKTWIGGTLIIPNFKILSIRCIKQNVSFLALKGKAIGCRPQWLSW
jgi:hypothetical protein